MQLITINSEFTIFSAIVAWRFTWAATYIPQRVRSRKQQITDARNDLVARWRQQRAYARSMGGNSAINVGEDLPLDPNDPDGDIQYPTTDPLNPNAPPKLNHHHQFVLDHQTAVNDYSNCSLHFSSDSLSTIPAEIVLDVFLKSIFFCRFMGKTEAEGGCEYY